MTKPATREMDREKDFPEGTLDLKGTKLNVLIRDKISFVGVAHLTSGGRSCSWALYHFPMPNCGILQRQYWANQQKHKEL